MLINKKKANGFTLIEVLVGLTILAVGLLAIASLHVTSIKGNSFSSHLMQATYVGQDGLEFLKNLSIDDIALTEGSHNDVNVIISDIVFKRSYSIIAKGDLKTINYKVTWNDGKDHTLNFSTIRVQ